VDNALGSVGSAVAFDPRDPKFEPCHRQFLFEQYNCT